VTRTSAQSESNSLTAEQLEIQLAIVLDTHRRPRKEPKMLVGGPGTKQAKRGRNASSLYAQAAPKFSSAVFAASPLWSNVTATTRLGFRRSDSDKRFDQFPQPVRQEFDGHWTTPVRRDVPTLSTGSWRNAVLLDVLSWHPQRRTLHASYPPTTFPCTCAESRLPHKGPSRPCSVDRPP